MVDAIRLTVLALLCVTEFGCGSSRLKPVPVSGQVLIDGRPLTSGGLRLIPSNFRPATGVIGSDGRFTLTTFDDRDGCIPGTHTVTVQAVDDISEHARRWNAPKKYIGPQTSGLTATIDGPTDSLVINLTWDGGKPFIERLDQR